MAGEVVSVHGNGLPDERRPHAERAADGLHHQAFLFTQQTDDQVHDRREAGRIERAIEGHAVALVGIARHAPFAFEVGRRGRALEVLRDDDRDGLRLERLLVEPGGGGARGRQQAHAAQVRRGHFGDRLVDHVHQRHAGGQLGRRAVQEVVRGIAGVGQIAGAHLLGEPCRLDPAP